MMLKTLDEIKAMDGHPDVSYGVLKIFMHGRGMLMALSAKF